MHQRWYSSTDRDFAGKTARNVNERGGQLCHSLINRARKKGGWQKLIPNTNIWYFNSYFYLNSFILFYYLLKTFFRWCIIAHIRRSHQQTVLWQVFENRIFYGVHIECYHWRSEWQVQKITKHKRSCGVEKSKGMLSHPKINFELWIFIWFWREK